MESLGDILGAALRAKRAKDQRRYVLQACIHSAAIGPSWVDLAGDNDIDILIPLRDKVAEGRPNTPLRIVNILVDTTE